MRSLLQFGCLFVSGILPGAQAAVVFISLEDRGLDFYAESINSRTHLDFFPGEGSLWLSSRPSGLSTGFLISQGPVRTLITLSPPPNIGGSVRALDAGSIIGASLSAPAGWNGGETPLPDNGDRYHLLYDASLVGVPVSEFFKEESYIGLEFEINGQTHYGWLSVELEPGDYPWNSRPASNRITGFAYETEPGVSVIAGLIPEPGIPILLAIGTCVLCIQRRNPFDL